MTVPELTAQWRTGPPDQIIAVEVWGRRAGRDAPLRIIDDADDMDAGTVTAGGTDDVLILWTGKARAKFASDWLDQQTLSVSNALANRWGSA